MEIIWLFLLFVFVLWGINKMPGHRAPAVSAGEKTTANIGAYPNYLDDEFPSLSSDPVYRDVLGLDE